MKPTLFIGSSREGLSIAVRVKESLSEVVDSYVWNEGFFESNTSSFESLALGATLFDFAILVATEDDLQLKRGTVEVIARDNVIFEFGLYVGRLGRNRSFFIKAKGLALPSDLFGITLAEFVQSPNEKGKTLEAVCLEISARILDLWETFELSFVPSTVLALGYFTNFVLPMARELMQSSKRVVKEKNFSDFKLHIIIPDELPNDFNDQVIAYLHNKKLEQMAVETITRKYNFYLDYAQDASDILKLYDLPTTLSALKKAIEMAIPASYLGETQRERMLKEKEVANFYRALQYLVEENSITKSRVIIEMIDVKV